MTRKFKRFISNWLLWPFIFQFVIVLNSCNPDDELGWDTQILLPVINSDLDFTKISFDTIISDSGDNSLKLVYRYFFQEIAFDTVLKIPDTTLVNTVTLKTIKLGKREIGHKITLGEIARENNMTLPHGFPVPIPAIPSISGGVSELDATNLFESIEVKTGTLTAQLFNGLPVDLTDIIIALRNKKSGDLIMNDTIALVKSNEQFERIYSLDGKFIEGMLEVEIVNISSPGSGTKFVVIDTNDALDIKAIVKIDEVLSAKAIFPTQNLVDKEDDVEYKLGGPELTFMKIKSGKLKIIVASTLPDSAFIRYYVPEAKLNGIDPLLVNVVLPPAEPGDTVYIERIYNVDNYWYDLTGKNHNKVNSFYNHLVMRIDSTGKMISLSLKDSIYIYYTLYNVIPEYVRGYLGTFSYNLSETVMVDFFKKITDGSIDLEKAEMKLVMENGIGAEGNIDIQSLSAGNSRNGVNTFLDLQSLTMPLSIPPAKENPYQPGIFDVSLNDQNSNISRVIETIPDKISYEIGVKINPDGNTGNYNDFLYNQSKVKCGLEAEMPLSFSADRLTFRDTLDFKFPENKLTNQITEGSMKLLISNSFPLDMNLKVYFADKNYKILDSLSDNTLKVRAGTPDLLTGRVTLPAVDKLVIKVSGNRLLNIRKAEYAILSSEFSTYPQNRHVKLYSDYKLNVRVIADFKAKAKI